MLCDITQPKNSCLLWTRPRSAVDSVSGNRCESDCRSRGREFNPGLVPYFHDDWSWNNFYIHSPPFPWIIQEQLLSVTSKSKCTKYWLTACPSCPRKNVVSWTDRPAVTIVVDLGRKATNLEDLKVLRRSPDVFNNVKIGQGHLPLILIKHILFYHIWGLQPF